MSPDQARRPAAERLHRHSLTRVVVLSEFEVMFLPIPKSGCTSVLWQLADLAGLPRESFTLTRTHEISRSMAIHDMELWQPEHRWRHHPAAEQDEILGSPDWLRFSVVRDPAPRLWSAWQSKILLREPRFVTRFGHEAWFPGPTSSVDAVVEAFRAFVKALDVHPDDAPHDAHWGPQSDLMAGFELNFVGRAESPAATVARLAQQVGDRGALGIDVPRENANPIPYHPSVYDAATADVLNRVYAADFADFGYPTFEAPGGADDAAWRGRAEARLLVVGELVERHLRIGELLDLLEDSETDRRHLAAEVAALLSSTSWRVTKPLRALRRH
jgi:hypothetical protein